MKRLTRDTLFDSAHLSHDLAGKSVRGGITTMTAQGIQFVLHLVGTMVLARLLTPTDFGLIGMVTVVVGFAQMFKDAGLSMATVQKDHISHEQISTLFWLNLLLSTALGLCILAASPLVAWFYGRPELTAVTAVLSLSFTITGLTIQHAALLRRHMCFGTLAAIHIASYLANLIVVVLLALAGWRHWALVCGSLATALSSTLLTLFFCPWIPCRMQRKTGVRSMLEFGGHLTVFNFINYFARNADNILVGRLIGADALGLYAKAYQIVYMPLTNIRDPINAVAIPTLSRLESEPERFRRYYAKFVFSLAFLSMPLMGFCAVFARELVLLILGSQWVDVTNIFRVLAIVGFIQPVAGTRGAVLVACGRTKVYLALGIVTAMITVAAFCIGVMWGTIGVAVSYAIVVYALQYPASIITFRHVPVSLGDFLGNCWHVALISCFSVTAARGIIALTPQLQELSLFWGAVVSFLLMSFLLFGVPVTRRTLQESLLTLRGSLPGRVAGSV
jgi:PST family polysaccharide transporter